MATSAPPPSLDLTPDEVGYLKSQKNQYFAENRDDKRDLRAAIVKHLIDEREVAPDNPYATPLLATKVKNWFGNNGPQRPTRLPFKLHRSYTAKQVYEYQNKQDILDHKRGMEGKAHVQIYTEARDALFNRLTEEELEELNDLAASWNLNGPDEKYKPLIADARSQSWMRAFTEMMYQQCRMVVFTYGMYVDPKRKLKVQRHDTSELWAEDPEDTGAQFFDKEDWDTDFRKNFQSFFRPFVTGEDNNDDTDTDRQRSERSKPVPFEFE
ncbi:hypothetical protein LXA43DRAFT_1100879 [Ganoderma leucocontextum]|nr:hypothetical protein LXA43DRAFT_1103013 [Ganoderma leucocontextum]KAI1784908.1 hypothetical protein LXA43DRAFT_1100879 [Ganoderma leucocontextum]